jgi:nitrate/nitrite transporter NarK
MSGAASEFRLGWKVVFAGAIGLGIGVSGAPFFTLGVFLKPLSGTFGWTRAETSAATLFLTFGAALTAPVVGRLADRLDVRKLALFSLFGITLAFLWLTRTNEHVSSWYFGLALLAFAGCGTTNLVWAHAITTWFDRSRGLALGLTLAGSGISGIVAPRALDTVIRLHGWRAGYVALALFTLLVAIPVVFLFFREKPAADAEQGQIGAGGIGRAAVGPPPGLTVAQTLRTRQYWQLAIGIMLPAGAIAAMIVHLVPLLTDAGLSRDSATSIAGLLGFALVAGRIANGFLVDRLHAPYVAWVFLTLPGIGYLLIAMGAASGSGAVTGWSAQTGWSIGLATILFGVSAGAEADLLAFLASRLFGRRAFGAIYGLLLLPFGFGGGVAPVLLGRVYDLTGHYTIALYGGAVACIVGAAMVGTLGRHPPWPQADDLPATGIAPAGA